MATNKKTLCFGFCGRISPPPPPFFLARFNYCGLFLQREHITPPSLHLSTDYGEETSGVIAQSTWQRRERNTASFCIHTNGLGADFPLHGTKTESAEKAYEARTDPCEQQPSLPLGGWISSESAHCSGKPSRRLLEGIN